jgi:hypothetical protein
MKRISPLKAIRLKCLECCSGSWLQVKNCKASDCCLWEFRFGKNPHKKGNIANLKPFPKKDKGFPTGVLAKRGIVESNARQV